MRITILGSGSAGNCTLVESDTAKLLIDAGLSGRQIAVRLALIDRSPDQLSGVILTHEHSDHVRGLGVLCKTRALPVYANRLTAEAVTTDPEWPPSVRISWRLFSTGSPFEMATWLWNRSACRTMLLTPWAMSFVIQVPAPPSAC